MFLKLFCLEVQNMSNLQNNNFLFFCHAHQRLFSTMCTFTIVPHVYLCVSTFQHHNLFCYFVTNGLFCWFVQLCCVPCFNFKWVQLISNVFKAVSVYSCYFASSPAYLYKVSFFPYEVIELLQLEVVCIL